MFNPLSYFRSKHALLDTIAHLKAALADSNAAAANYSEQSEWKHQALVGKCDALKAEVKTLRADRDAAWAAAGDNERLAEALQEDLDKAKAERDELAAERDELSRQIRVSQSIADQAKSERDDAAKNRDAMAAALAGAEDCLRRAHALTSEYFGVEAGGSS